MRKLIPIMLLLLLITPSLRAQRKELSQARSYIKSGKDLDKAVALMKDLLAKDSTNRSNPKVYLTWFQAVEKKYAAGNESLYLKQKYDTAALFDNVKEMFVVLETLDSVMASDKDKAGQLSKIRRKSGETLHAYRPNLYFGGSYFVRKANYAKAYEFFDTYLRCDTLPLFAPYDFRHSDKHMTEAAYWASFSGFKLQQPQKTLAYAELAESDTAKLQYLLRYKAEAYHSLKDEAHYVEALRRGFGRYPAHSYFFAKLMDYYTGTNQLDEALALADEALKKDGDSPLFLFAKSTVLLNLGRNEECVELTQRLIKIDATSPEPYYNAGTALLNEVLTLEKNPRENKEAIRALYQRALPFMEKYRVLAPKQTDRWAPALYRIYLNLNMGKQFDDIDQIINKAS